MILQASPTEARVDATDLSGLRRHLARLDPQSRLAPIEMTRFEISDVAHLRVEAAIYEALKSARTVATPPRVVILTDMTPIRRDGHVLSEVVEAQVAGRFQMRVVRLDDGYEALHASELVLSRAAAAVAGADIVVTIGSGTMTDIGKVAAEHNGGIPHVVIQTAASVDGFTDNVSVILKNGVKRTVPSRWPTVVLADVVTITGAPREMNTAGFGEALSLFTAPADWYLASLVGLDSTYHPASMALLRAAASEPPVWSAGLAEGEHAATRELTRLLALRGIVSGISDTTACLSGVEHVISHMLDLHHGAHHQPIGLHGEQVGVASLVASKLWRAAIEGDWIRSDRLTRPDPVAMEAAARRAFADLGDDGVIAEECWRDGKAKIDLLEANWARIEALVANWSRLTVEFNPLVTSSDTLRDALKAAGAPTTFMGLKQSVSPALARWATANCHLMRKRFNLVDLLALLGLWTEERVAWALDGTLGDAS